MYNMISWWARNPKAANLLMAAIIIVGIATFSRIEYMFPKIAARWSLFIIMARASPKEVEDQILVRVEEFSKKLKVLKKLEGLLRKILGNICPSISGTDLNFLIQKLKEKQTQLSQFPRCRAPSS